MRSIMFEEPTSDNWVKWRKKCEKETKKLVDSWTPGGKLKIKDGLYKKFKKEVYFKRDLPFNGKCVYCESPLGRHDDLDHYRPKKRVDDENDKRVTIDINGKGKEEDHPGYYWLAYYWKNLLPACKECNSPSETIGKRNRFPISGVYAIKSGEEKDEFPLILNPLDDNPDEHLDWDETIKMITAKPTSEKGKMTLGILGFHEREQLRQDWIKAHKDTINEIMNITAKRVESIENHEKSLNEFVSNVSNGKVPHSFVALKTLENLKIVGNEKLW